MTTRTPQQAIARAARAEERIAAAMASVLPAGYAVMLRIQPTDRGAWWQGTWEPFIAPTWMQATHGARPYAKP